MNSDREQRELAKKIVKESSNTVIKMGLTNGRRCLHLNVKSSVEGGRRYSETIYSLGEWLAHRENRATRRKPKEDFLSAKDHR